MAQVLPRRFTSPNPWTPPSQKSSRTSTLANVRDEAPSSPTKPLRTISEEGTNQSQDENSTADPRRSKRFSWVPGWSFAGERRQSKSSPATPEDENAPSSPTDSVTSTSNRRESAVTRFGRRFSSIGDSWVFQHEPSHETNFPPSVEFPEEDGRKVCLSVFGTIDSLDGTVMRLQVPMGLCQADLADQKEYKPVLEYMGPKLKNGDMLVRPFMARFSRDPNMAMVVRGAMQDYVFKCHIVGIFPMKVFGDELPVPYAMDAYLY